MAVVHGQARLFHSDRDHLYRISTYIFGSSFTGLGYSSENMGFLSIAPSFDGFGPTCYRRPR
ncbi:hypothetical protein WG66_009654 [Moniliophthora roreri]|nr:hypothetical protein WG66_009654 [Moniliophthora roreri]